MISELKIYNFRRFKSVDGAPGLQITFHKGLNALIGENDSGKTAIIDALIFKMNITKMMFRLLYLRTVRFLPQKLTLRI